MSMSIDFSDMDDARAYVETALCEYAGDYDIDAIAREVTGWVDGRLVLLCNGESFWDACARHDMTLGHADKKGE